MSQCICQMARSASCHVGPICSVKNWSCGTIITPLRVRHGVSGDAAFARCGGCFKGTATGNDAFYDQNTGLCCRKLKVIPWVS